MPVKSVRNLEQSKTKTGLQLTSSVARFLLIATSAARNTFLVHAVGQ